MKLRERGRENVCVSEKERVIENAHLIERERKNMCISVCVSKRKSKIFRVWKSGWRNALYQHEKRYRPIDFELSL